VPVVAFAVIAWAGLSAARSDKSAAAVAEPTTTPAPSLDIEAAYPTDVVGLEVQRLGDVPQLLGRDEVVAVAGWYVPTSITDCPPLAVLYREGALPEIRHDVDTWAFCDRSGVLFASRPDPAQGTNDGFPAVAVRMVVGVMVPPELEAVGTGPTEVVGVGRFVRSGENCDVSPGCAPELLVDHVAWTSGAA
jgi:hypothetical protein